LFANPKFPVFEGVELIKVSDYQKIEDFPRQFESPNPLRHKKTATCKDGGF
jgi:hypothetical protein